MNREARVMAVAALTLALIAGCGGSSSSSSTGGGGPLGEALAGVSTASSEPLTVTWVDTAQLREIADLPASSEQAISEQRWNLPVGLAAGSKLADQVGVTDYGFDPLAADRTIEIGSPPDDAARYDGVDADAVTSAFEDLGFEQDGDFLALGEEGEIVPASLDESGVGPVGINRVAFDGDSMALGAYEEPVQAALGQAGDPVAGIDGVAAASGCLGGDVFAAQIFDPAAAASDAVALAAVGLEAPASGSDVVGEVVCAVGAPDGSLDEVAGCMDGNFNGGGLEPQTQQPYADILGKAEIEQGDTDGTPWVRASFEPPPSDPVGRVFQLVQTQALAAPLGATSPEAVLGGATPEQAKALQQQVEDACSG